MTPVGSGTSVQIAGTTYCFETVSFFVTSRAESTALIGGGVYRAGSSAYGFGCRMSTRFHHADMAAYVTLMQALSATRSTVVINGVSYQSLVLTNGRVTSKENSQYAMCELEFTEVDG